ncbi:MAG: flagellar biosynthesis/type III secretory pathway chaperone [Pseudohongiellaceae bacterium]
MLQLSELYTLLDSETDHCLLLINILLAERRLIETRQLDELPNILRQKADLLAVIESGHNQRKNWLQSVGLPTSYSEFLKKVENREIDETEASTSSSPSAALCQEKWQELNTAKESCNEQNTVNGIVISKAKKRNGEQLGILKGINPGKELYDAKGQAINCRSSQSSHIA